MREGEMFLAAVHFKRPAQHLAVVRRHVCVVDAILSDSIWVRTDWMYLGHPEISIIIFASTKTGVETADLLKPFPAIHDGGMHADQITLKQVNVGALTGS
jgi:hypothetical protein